MNYLFVGLIVFCIVTFIVTSAIIGRILIDSGLKDSMFYNFDTWNLFYNHLKENKSKRYKVLFWMNVVSLIMAFSVIVIAAYYYN
jgi:hypothetical protein